MRTPRRPAVAGRFYPGDARRLQSEVTRHLVATEPARRVLAAIGPHAGYMYSGSILGETYARIEVPRRVVIVSPNHTGMGVRRSVWAGGDWELPGQPVPVDEELATALVEQADLAFDIDAHLLEHAIEVHLPFLRARRPDVQVVPITLASLSVRDCRQIGEAIADVIAAQPDDVLLVASTDMSHFHDAQTAKELDELALQRVLALDPVGLHETVRERDISMCGYIPTTVSLFAAMRRGATKAELVRYGNSGEASGDLDRVVGYAGVLVD